MTKRRLGTIDKNLRRVLFVLATLPVFLLPHLSSYYSSDNLHLSHEHDTNMEVARAIRKKSFDCSVNWVRIPKTASTTIYDRFFLPLEQSQSKLLFSTTYLTENTCITGPGGCSAFWYESGGGSVTRNNNTPHFGIDSESRGTHDPVSDGWGAASPAEEQ